IYDIYNICIYLYALVMYLNRYNQKLILQYTTATGLTYFVNNYIINNVKHKVML
ncbi:hypothetical protein BDB01DRAFT_799535, partial [Pilobolus umbonatus]